MATEEKRVLRKVVMALKAARDHLDYCGYGDAWERECAQALGTEKKIKEGLVLGEALLKGEVT